MKFDKLILATVLYSTVNAALAGVSLLICIVSVMGGLNTTFSVGWGFCAVVALFGSLASQRLQIKGAFRKGQIDILEASKRPSEEE